MKPEERRTHMWRAIALRAFSPASVEECARWLHAFAKTAWMYINDNAVCDSLRVSKPPFVGRFGHQSLLTCRFHIEPERSHFDIYMPEWSAQYGLEDTVFAMVLEKNEVVDDVTSEDIDQVLTGMIEHPRAHLHMFDDRNRHEVRIGMGLDGPFLFLFQLRFQLCLDQDRRQLELARLRGIFTQDWFLRKRDPVSPEHLFGLN